MLAKVFRRVRVTAIRASLKFRPHLTVVVADEVDREELTRITAFLATAVPSVQVLFGSPRQGVRRARGPAVAFVDAVDLRSIRDLHAVGQAPYTDATLVPVPRTRDSRGDALIGLAGTSAFSAFVRRDVRRTLARASLAEPMDAAYARMLAASALIKRPVAVMTEDELFSGDADAVATARRVAIQVVLSQNLPAAPHTATVQFAVLREASRALGIALRREPHRRAECVNTFTSTTSVRPMLDVLNGEMATKLVVAYAFPPFMDASGFIAARRMAIAGEPYDVLTKDLAGARPLDERSLELSHDLTGRRMVVKGRVGFGSWKAIELFCERGASLVAQREETFGAYNTVYSRAMWPAASVFGALYKVRNPQTRWVAEISDPFRVRTDGTVREYALPASPLVREIVEGAQSAMNVGAVPTEGFEAIEWMTYALADEIIFTNENQRELMLSTFPHKALADRARGLSRVEHHPVPPPDQYTRAAPAPDLPADKVTIGYFGRFYAVRGIADLLDPFAQLIPAERDAVRLLIFTTNRDEVAAEIAAHPARECVDVRDALPYFAFLATASSLDWLLIADARTDGVFASNPYLPSKFADYKGSGTPIWALAEPGSVLSRQRVEASSSLGDTEAAARVLRSMVPRRS